MSEAQLVIKKVNLEIEAHSRVRSISRIPAGMSDKLARQSLSRQSHALLVHHGLFDLRRISRLHLYLDAIQFSLEILLRRGVHHFFLDPRGIGDPARMTRDVLHGGTNVRRLYRVRACGTLQSSVAFAREHQAKWTTSSGCIEKRECTHHEKKTTLLLWQWSSVSNS